VRSKRVHTSFFLVVVFLCVSVSLMSLFFLNFSCLLHFFCVEAHNQNNNMISSLVQGYGSEDDASDEGKEEDKKHEEKETERKEEEEEERRRTR